MLAVEEPAVTAHAPARGYRPAGIYYDISNEEYHAGPEISSTRLKLLIEASAAHYQHAVASVQEEKEAFRIGTAIHCAVLEPDRFTTDYVVLGKEKQTTKKAREDWADKVENATASGRIVITEKEMEMIRGIREKIGRHKGAMKLLVGSEREVSMYWVDPDTGVHCRIRHDAVSVETASIADLKSTTDASPEGFGKVCANFSYHVSAAMYAEGFYRCVGERPEFNLIACEKEPPYEVAVYRVPPKMMARGESLFRSGLETYAKCLQTGVWPGYQPDGEITDVHWPSWAR